MKTLADADAKAEIASRMARLRPDSARRWGRMTPHEAVCHLSDSFRCVIGRKQVSMRTTLLWRTVGKWGALYLPVRWPPGIRTRPEIDQRKGGTRPVEFAADVAALAALVELITAESPSFEWQSHPLFGRMSRADWLRWGYLHMDHHLRQFGA
jgi:hypothetical protein